MPDPVQDLPALRRQIAEANDERLRRIVGKVDAMASRGEADGLIAPLRSRLRLLQPARPLRFARLLFHPLNALMVTPTRWTPAETTLSRSIVVPMTRIVEAAMGAKAQGIRESIRHGTTDDAALIAGIGATFWPEAASVLAAAPAPARWEETGLPPRVFKDLAVRVAALLRQAPALDELVIATANGLLPPDRGAIEAVVRGVGKDCPAAMPMLAVILISRLSQTAGLLYEVSAGGTLPGLRTAVEQAADLLLRRLEAGRSVIATRPLTAFTAAAHQVAVLLAELDHDQAPRDRREQVRALRQRLDQDCRQQFEQGLETQFLQPLQAAAERPAALDLHRLEDTARGLRVLEAEGRAIGSPAAYQERMAEAADAVRALPPDSGITLAARVRLLEILSGPEAALALLEREGGPLGAEP